MLNRIAGFAATFLISVLVGASPVSGEVTRLDIAVKQPFGSFRAGDYVIWQGKIHGDLSPQESIPGLDKATRNARGRVDYSARIILIIPAEQGRGNGALLVDV